MQLKFVDTVGTETHAGCERGEMAKDHQPGPREGSKAVQAKEQPGKGF